MTDVLRVQDVVAGYGEVEILHGVSIAVSEAEIVAIIGPNGAGKTTSFRMTCGLTEPDAGRVMLNETDVTNLPMYQRAQQGMGYLAQESSVFRKLTVEKNLLAVLELLGKLDRQGRRRRCDELLEQLNISHLRKSMA
ncbi:hypothetical protein LCGC14_2855520, partial [marine sediment metagenome]